MAKANLNEEYHIILTGKELRVVMLGLAHLAYPDDIKPKDGDRAEAAEINRLILLAKRQALLEKLKSAEDALDKVTELTKGV